MCPILWTTLFCSHPEKEVNWLHLFSLHTTFWVVYIMLVTTRGRELTSRFSFKCICYDMCNNCVIIVQNTDKYMNHIVLCFRIQYEHNCLTYDYAWLLLPLIHVMVCDEDCVLTVLLTSVAGLIFFLPNQNFVCI